MHAVHVTLDGTSGRSRSHLLSVASEPVESLDDCTITKPSGDSLEVDLWEAMRKTVDDALAAPTVNAFLDATEAKISRFASLMHALAALRRGVLRAEHEDRVAFMATAEHVGGEQWSQVVSDARSMILRAVRILRSISSDTAATPDAWRLKSIDAIDRFRRAFVVNSWAMMAMLRMAEDPSLDVVQAVKDEVLALIDHSATSAYVAIRGFQIERERDLEVEEVSSPPEPLDPEIAALEREAHVCGQELLRRIEGEREAG